MWKHKAKAAAETRVLSCASFVFSGCHSATLLHTIPDGAQVHRDGKIVYITPCEVEPRAPWLAGSLPLELGLTGYQPEHIELARNDVYVARIIFFPFFWPWAAGLEPSRYVELSPLPGTPRRRAEPRNGETDTCQNRYCRAALAVPWPV